MSETTYSYKQLLEKATSRCDLSATEMATAVCGILEGEWTPVQTAGFLVAMKIKGETPEELAAAADVMRTMMIPVSLADDNAVDTCGTGGDGAGLFNVSTAAAFVAAAAGVCVAKHGNRALSSTSGSSDLLSELGASLDTEPDKIAELIQRLGIGFMFAPNHHPAMRHAAPVRRELGVRTMFNLLGPLCNPAGVRRQVTGVFNLQLLVSYAETLAACGAQRAMVVHGEGLDEITIAGETAIAEWRDGAIVRYTIAPTDVGLSVASLDSLRVSSAAESAALINAVFAGNTGAARDIVLLNAAAALMVADKAVDFADGVQQAAVAVDSGAAAQKLSDFVAASS